MPAQTLHPAAVASNRKRLTRFIAVLGPGLVVMLADTDVGSIITAGQSGVQWGYRLLLLQLLLVPILYMVQEMTVRLGIFTGRGHGELIRDTFGPVWAWVSAGGLAIATAGALLTEFSGVAGVGELYGVSASSLSLTDGRGPPCSCRRVDRVLPARGAGRHRWSGCSSWRFFYRRLGRPSRACHVMVAQGAYQYSLVTDPGYLYLVRRISAR